MEIDWKMIKRSRLIHVCFAISYFTTGLVINFLQCILYLTLHKLNKRLYRKINYYLCYSLYSLLVFLTDWWSVSNCTFYIDKDDFEKFYGKEHAYCIMNHTYEVDWLMGWMITERIGILGNCKAYAKKDVQYLPVLGWCWKFSEFVFLERSFERDRANIIRQVGELADHPDPIWLLLFPEGTRFSATKQKSSEEFANEKNLKQLKHHLQPRTRGFVASLPAMEGKVGAVYDISLVFDEREPIKPTITNLLFGLPINGHMYMKRIPLDQVPKGEEEQTEFLREMFQRKDALMESFFKTGDFFATSGIERVEGFKLPRRIFPLINMVFWMTVTIAPIVYLLTMFLWYGQILYFNVGVGILLAVYILLNSSIDMSKISKQSSYGADGANGQLKKNE